MVRTSNYPIFQVFFHPEISERNGEFFIKILKLFLDEGINLLDVASLEQRFDQPEFQPESVKDLYPRNRLEHM